MTSIKQITVGSKPRGKMHTKRVPKSWFEQVERSEHETSTESDSLVSEDENIPYSMLSDKESEHMTIDDPASDQYTNNMDSDTSEQVIRKRPTMKRQTSLESYPSSSYSGYSTDRSSVSADIHQPHRKRFHHANNLETDQAILARREKQIDYGKNTTGYIDYITQVPIDKRTAEHPKTPPKHMKYSRRSFDAMVKIWRRQLHDYDCHDQATTISETNEDDDDTMSD